MLKANQNAIVKWNSANRKHYTEKGYIFTKWKDEFEVKIEDLSQGSHTKVIVICDYCGNERKVTFKDYLRCHDTEFGDCCSQCTKLKREDVLFREFGVKSYWETDECKQKIAQVCLEKYGVDAYMKTKEFRQKSIETFDKNSTQKTSSQQILIYEMLLERYGNCQINYPLDYYSLDCFLEVEGVKIDIEYDGWFWHKDNKSSDNRRDGYMYSKGIKVLRVKGRYKVPTVEELEDCINKLIKGDRYQEILLD